MSDLQAQAHCICSRPAIFILSVIHLCLFYVRPWFSWPTNVANHVHNVLTSKHDNVIIMFIFEYLLMGEVRQWMIGKFQYYVVALCEK
jgi:hypothetical protein